MGRLGFAEAFTAADGAWLLLLEDLTATHEALGDWPIPSTVEQSDRIIDAHARFHAHWWDDARLGESVGAFLDTSGALNRHLASFAKDFSTFVDRLGDRLSPEHKALYERLLAAAPRLLARYSSHRNLTIVHGDAHVWNVMMPRDPGQVGLRLIDWDGWRVDQATDDLAYMIALFWPAERRRRLERRALERYHATLLAHGVGGYGFDALWQDYRYSVLWQCATPVWQAAHKLGPWIWWPNLERVVSDAGTGLARGVKLLNEARSGTPHDPEQSPSEQVQNGLDVFHTEREMQRIVSASELIRGGT